MSHRSTYVLPGAKDPGLLSRVLTERGIRHHRSRDRWELHVDGETLELTAGEGEVRLAGWDLRRGRAAERTVAECIQRANYLFVVEGLRRKGFLKERERVDEGGAIEVVLTREVA